MESEKQTILIVDDETGNIRVLNELLSKTYKIFFATTGEKALKIVATEKIDLILLDVVMPEIDGYEICRRLKRDSSTQHIPVVFITARISSEDEIKGFEAGAVDYITKPFVPQVVQVRVKTQIELKKYRDILENLSKMDGLTNVPNRRRFDEFLDESWKRGMRTQTPLSLIMLDIDHFKQFNDHYGHAAGDECLKTVASSLKTAVKRSTDLLARYGGEEFACILPGTDAKGAFTLAEDLKNTTNLLNIPHSYSSASDHVTISIGVATVIPLYDKSTGQFDLETERRPVSAQELIKVADSVLYEAKKNGRNRISTWNGV